ncbi:hypothetical protein B0H14DRAFT_3145253 [Mycena olivaceomarginata]|nr:hypothetical protein B0H14DRAFT_3145253 [Mycena olivaceomarginata]
MATRKSVCQTTTPTTNVASALQPIFTPFPKGLDDRFRSPSDPPGNHVQAYERAAIYGASLADTHAASLWQCALDIGFSAGRYLAMQAVRKEGEALGFEKGKVEGLSEGKRLGFVAGREFGEKQAAKLNKPVTFERVLVDVGTDSPAAELPPPPHPSPVSVDASTQTDEPPAIIACAATGPPFAWADDHHTPDSTFTPPPASRDFSALRSDSNTTKPFASLQFRARRKHRPACTPRTSPFRTPSHRRPPAPVHHLTDASFAPKPTRVSLSALDWDRDPRLSDLNRALHSMGWRREERGAI